MTKAWTLEDVLALVEKRGQRMYGREAVSQLEHALQCAHLAETAGASAALISACLLHDFGHLLEPLDAGADDQHQDIALPVLRRLFAENVLEPIRLHVAAKRYLCAAESGYWESLSIASRESLERQGGVFSARDAERFIAQNYAEDAVRLRRWDDTAKTPGRATPEIGHYKSVLEKAMSGLPKTG